MLTKITLIIALCSGSNYQAVQKKMNDLQSHNPGATISVRVDKKAVCSNGQVLTGKDAKLIAELSGK